MADPYVDLLDLLARVGREGHHSAFCIGTVLQAGGGRLRVKRGELPLEKEDLWVNPELDWRWTEDFGDRSYLRPGDRVVLLSPDDQTYYLICKAVRP